MRAQQALDQKGFHAGRADGILGPRTKQALSMFQQQQKLQRTGQLDNRTLSALGVSQGPVSTTGAGTTQTGKSGVSTTGHSGAGKGPANMTAVIRNEQVARLFRSRSEELSPSGHVATGRLTTRRS